MIMYNSEANKNTDSYYTKHMNVWLMNDVQEETFNKATYPALNWVVNQSSPGKVWKNLIKLR